MCYVMIVSNDIKERQYLHQVLNEDFLNAVVLPEAATATEALKIAQLSQPELLLLSLTLPDEESSLLYKEIIALHPSIKVVLFDDVGDFKRAQFALRAGAIDYLVRPVQSTDVKNAIHRAIINLNHVSLLNRDGKLTTYKTKQSVDRMFIYLHSNYQKNLTLNDLADHVHLNKNYVSRLFKETVGMTFIAYLTNYRIQRSKDLLRSTTDNITDIAMAVGYIEPTYFSRVFKKDTLLTPLQYRQRYHID